MCVTENSKHSVITAGNGPPAKLARRDTETSTSVTPAGAPLGVMRAKRFRRKKKNKNGALRKSSLSTVWIGASGVFGSLQRAAFTTSRYDRHDSFFYFFFWSHATPRLRPPCAIVSFTYLLLKSLGRLTVLHRTPS